MKERLRRLGCTLTFFDFLDSYAEEFKKIVDWGKERFPSLGGVYEVDDKTLDDNLNWRAFAEPNGWTYVTIEVDDATGASYTAPDMSANMRGSTTVFRDPGGNLKTVVQVGKNPKFELVHPEHKYAMKIATLLHEFGHVDDIEKKINLDYDRRTGDIIEAEVYANLFALEICYQRGYFATADTIVSTYTKYKDLNEYRGEVARRLLERFKPPVVKRWQEYEL